MERAAKRQRGPQASSSADGTLMLEASGRVTVPLDVVDGRLLPVLARDNLAGFARVLPQGHSLALGTKSARQQQGPALKLSWASCCSGSEGVFYVVEAANMAMEEAGFPVEFAHAFSCELNPKKREWIATVLQNGTLWWRIDSAQATPCEDLGCIFGDVCDLGGREAKCHTHKRLCPVPQVDCLFIGGQIAPWIRASQCWVKRRAREPLRRRFKEC